jgi:hypothetical protein
MTIESRLDILEKELIHAQRRNRFLWAGMALMIGIGLVTQAYGSKTEKQIRSNSFVLEDANGKARAALSMVKDKPALVLLDEKGMARAQLGINELGARFALFDEKGIARAQLGMNELGPRFVLFDEKGMARTQLGMNELGPGFVLFDEKGIARSQLGMNKYGNPEMDLFNKKSKSQVVLSIGNTGAAGLILGDEEGRIVWSAP